MLHTSSPSMSPRNEPAHKCLCGYIDSQIYGLEQMMAEEMRLE